MKKITKIIMLLVTVFSMNSCEENTKEEAINSEELIVQLKELKNKYYDLSMVTSLKLKSLEGTLELNGETFLSDGKLRKEYIEQSELLGKEYYEYNNKYYLSDTLKEAIKTGKENALETTFLYLQIEVIIEENNKKLTSLEQKLWLQIKEFTSKKTRAEKYFYFFLQKEEYSEENNINKRLGFIIFKKEHFQNKTIVVFERDTLFEKYLTVKKTLLENKETQKEMIKLLTFKKRKYENFKKHNNKRHLNNNR